MEKIINIVFTDGTSPDKPIRIPDGYDMKKLPAWLAKKYPGKTVATVDGQPFDPNQGASVTPPEEVDAGKVGNAIGKTINSAGKWIGNTAMDVGSALGRGTWGALKGIAGYDESVKAQDDAVLERIKSIKY